MDNSPFDYKRNKSKMKKLLFIIAILAITFAACKKDSPTGPCDACMVVPGKGADTAFVDISEPIPPR